MDLFSSFDYCWSNFTVLKLFEVSWISSIWLFVFFSFGLNLTSSYNLFGLGEVLKTRLWSKSLNNQTMLFIFMVMMFQFMLMEKGFGLFPYVFSITSHMMFNLVMALFLWFGMVLFLFTLSFEDFFVHLTPLGAPMALVPLLNVIELISISMRPLTLSLRLGMNMTAGHMFLALLSVGLCMIMKLTSLIFWIVASLLLGYFLIEFGISLIQSFVFNMLIVQYSDE